MTHSTTRFCCGFILFLFATFTSTQIIAQIGPIAQGNNPNISYKITRNINTGCYEVYFKSSMGFNNQRISSTQITLVVPKGSINHTILPDANISATSQITFMTTFTGNKYEIGVPPNPLGNTNDYITFGITGGFRVSVPANTDYLLFSFCLVNNACIGAVRLMNGISIFSPFYNASNGCTACSYYTGPTDPTQENLDRYNSMAIDNGPPSSNSNIYPIVLEGYQGNNYGDNLTACSSIDLIPVITAPALTTPATPVIYTITTKNIGSLASSGKIIEVLTIPSNMTYNSGGGNGWTCTPPSALSGPATITCSTSNSIPASSNNLSSFPISLTPTTSKIYLVIATLSGGGDTVTSNNQSSLSQSLGSVCSPCIPIKSSVIR